MIGRQAQHQATGGTAICAMGGAFAMRGAIGLRIPARGNCSHAVMGRMLVVVHRGYMALRDDGGRRVRQTGHGVIGAHHKINGDKRQHQNKPWPKRWTHSGRDAQKAHDR